jgi:hypothetical protein
MRCHPGCSSASSLAWAGIAALLVVAGAATAVASPAKLEAIEGSDVKRVILDAKASERIGIQMTPVREEKVVVRTVVLGEVKNEPAAKMGAENPESFGSAPGTPAKPSLSPSGQMRVLVLLDADPDDDVDDDVGDIDDEDSAEIMAPGDDDDDDQPLLAKRVAMASQGETDANTLYFKIPGGVHHNLTAGQRVGVRLAAPGSGAPKKVIPYSAVLYDASGDAWVYTSPEPLQFVRARVTIDRIDGDQAVLQEGPVAGTKVVTVGAAELFGAESGVGR